MSNIKEVIKIAKRIVSINIDETIWKRALEKARKNNTSISKLIEEFLAKYVSTQDLVNDLDRETLIRELQRLQKIIKNSYAANKFQPYVKKLILKYTPIIENDVELRKAVESLLEQIKEYLNKANDMIY